MRRLVPFLSAAVVACSGGDKTPDSVDTDVVIPDDTFGGTDDSGGGVDTDVVADTDVADTDNGSGHGGGGGGGSINCTTPSALGLQYACDLSVNGASAKTITGHGNPLVLDVTASTSAPAIGAYNGNGRGNRAIAGLHGYNRLNLSDLDEITFDALKISGSYSVELGIQADLACDSANLVYLTVVATSFATPVQVDGHDRYRVRPDQALWHAQGGLVDPSNPFGFLLNDPGAADPTPNTLSAFIAAYPDACIHNFNAGFRDLPRSTAASGILLTLGSSVQYLQRAQWEIYRVQINDDVLLPPP